LNTEKSAFFDSQISAPWASADYSQEEVRKIERMLRLSGLAEGMRVIEPGCGTGRLTRILAERVGKSGLVLSSDISMKMIDICRRNLRELPQAEIYCLPVEELVLNRESFDLVICHNVFPHFDDKPRVLRHLSNALGEGGTFIIFHLMNSQWVNDLHRKTHPAVLRDMLPDENELRMMMKDVGLEINLLEDGDSGYLLRAAKVDTARTLGRG
jgi:demethylmenaquinone methyltransferase/2-methoxy-6-polyprenyl-1,4-benzoquinol methylase